MNRKSKLPSAARHGGAIMGFAFALGVALDSHDADACGACYANQSESTIVNDHRMALAISPNMTVLWDQIAYSGTPSQFAYVIPAKPGSRLEVSNDGWFAALDASTRPIIMAPKNQSFGGYPGGGGGTPYRPGTYSTGDGDGTGGCCAATSESAFAAESGPNFGAQDAGAGSFADAGTTAQADPVQIVSQEVVGPYETVTLRSEDPDALFKWLQANDFDIPEASKPIVRDYVSLGLDFIAMRMRPAANARAMEPIRIVSPGPDPTLPLRMMRIGSGANLGVTLFVLGEARYRAKNFPNVTIDPQKIVWDYAQSRSNYIQLSQAAMTAGDGRGWLTEYAEPPVLERTGSIGTAGMIGNPGLADAYETVCPSFTPYVPVDASTTFDSGGGGDLDAGADADTDAGDAAVDSDAGDAGAPATLPPRTRTLQCDDLDLALTGMHQSDVWLTRMRAFLPNAAMDTPLELEPVLNGPVVDNVHYASISGTVSARIAPSKTTRGTWGLIALGAFVVTRLLRRRR